ncbi:hypothetical protein AC578_4123 [Pseudocercospora eumusae]|uniref:Uncharacterized protein n=1 Tax=Pseudocercospora eumusae TaxID=321146 RepID=A0A139HF34_9PEZI|nr:hypothetical protein AC578_4123 [Pseudocercospora eumusae]
MHETFDVLPSARLSKQGHAASRYIWLEPSFEFMTGMIETLRSKKAGEMVPLQEDNETHGGDAKYCDSTAIQSASSRAGESTVWAQTLQPSSNAAIDSFPTTTSDGTACDQHDAPPRVSHWDSSAKKGRQACMISAHKM